MICCHKRQLVFTTRYELHLQTHSFVHGSTPLGGARPHLWGSSITLSKTSLEEWSAHRGDCLPDNTQHSKQERDIHVPGGIRTRKRPQTHALHRTATGVGGYFRLILAWKWAGSSVGIATELRAGRFGTESRWGRDFPPVQTGPGAHPASCKMGTGSFPGGKCGRGVLLTTHPLPVPRSWKVQLPLPTLWATPGL